jgi:hypothetical protein
MKKNLNRIKHFYRWLADGHLANVTVSNWDIPVFAQIKKQKSNRKSSYSENQIWAKQDNTFFVLGSRCQKP